VIGRLIYPAAARPLPMTGDAGISLRAVISKDARLEDGVTIEAGAVIAPAWRSGRARSLPPML